jgi:hypothetical protein
MTCDKDYNTNGAHGGSPIPHTDNGCKPLPNATSNLTDHCPHNQAFAFNSNGTIALATMQSDRGEFMHHCLQIQQHPSSVDEATLPLGMMPGASGVDANIYSVVLADCISPALHGRREGRQSGGLRTASPNQPNQVWSVTSNSGDGTVTIEQDGLCIDNNYNPNAPPMP